MIPYTNPIRWGIIGLGKISNSFAQDLALVQNSTLSAVASRDIQKAEAFAKAYNAPEFYGSYEALIQDPNIDVVYIGSVNSDHFPLAMLCLEHGKSVLCEKPLAINTDQIKQMARLARSKKVFLMEALWTRFLPPFLMADQLVREGKIGKVLSIQADFSVQMPFDAQGRLYNKDLGGGALLDIGIYPIFLAHHFLGTPNRIQATKHISTTQVEDSCQMLFEYKDAVAQLSCSFRYNQNLEAWIIGNEGRIKIHFPFHSHHAKVEIFKDWQNSELIKLSPIVGNGYQYEAQEVVDCLLKGQTESTLMPLETSIALMEIMETVQKI